MDAVEELRAEVATTNKPDEDAKRAAREAFATGYFARWAANTSAQIRGPYIGGHAISVADLKLYVAMRSYPKGVYDYIPSDILSPYPKIVAHLEAVASHPRVADWNA